MEGDMYRINHANIKEWAANYEGELFDGILCDPPYELGFMGKSWDSSGIAFDTEMWADLFKLLKPGGHLLAFSGSRTYHRMAVAIEDAGFEIRDQIIWLYGQGFPKALNINKQLKTCECGGNAVPYIHDSELRQLPERDEKEPIPVKEEQGQVLQSELSEQSTHSSMQGQEPSKGLKTGEEPSLEGRQLYRATEGLQDDTDARTPQSETERLCVGTSAGSGTDARQTVRGNRGSTSYQRGQSGQQTGESEGLPRPQQPLDGESLPRCSKCQRPILQGEYKTALKPSHEPAVLARKPLEKGHTVATNALKHGTGGLNIDGTRVGTENRYNPFAGNKETGFTADDDRTDAGKGLYAGNQAGGNAVTGRFPANLIHDGSDEVEAVFPQTGKSSGGRIGNKGSMINTMGNAYEKGDPGFGDSGSASRYFKVCKDDLVSDTPASCSEKTYNVVGVNGTKDQPGLFYTAKASKSERNAGLEGFETKVNGAFDGNIDTKNARKIGANPERQNQPTANHHPTVKPLSLTKYLATLIKPPTGGRLLVPFSGSGSEMIGALQAGWEYVEGIELTEEYIPIAEARIEYWLGQMNKQMEIL